MMEREDAYGFPKWCLLYTILMIISLFASLSAAWTLRKYSKLVSSCVCYAMLSFFYWKSFYSIFRSVVLIEIMQEYFNRNSEWITIDENHDVGGFRLVGHEVNVGYQQMKIQPPYYVKIPLFIGDTSLISSCFWMFVLVIELLRLVKTTLDRGAQAEKRYLRFYVVVNIAIVLLYFGGSFASTTSGSEISESLDESRFYATRFQTVLIASGVLQTIVIIAVSAGILYLNFAGLKLESVECRLVQKPLYLRLKRILVIYLLTTLPYVTIGWILAFHPGSTLNYIDKIPNEILILSNVLYAISATALAFVLVANQKCMLSLCIVSEEVIQQIQANEPPVDFPVFVNTDIESSSALWGQLGNAMHEAQDLHDNLLRNLLVNHNGYEITTAGDAFQLAFHNIGDAVAYCMDVQEKLLQLPWPPSLIDCQMPGSATILTPQSILKRPKTIFHGVRVRMGIHASNPGEGDLVNQIHPITGRMMYVGLSELIGREVSDIGHGGQIIVTAPIVRWLRANIDNNTTWAKTYPCVFKELGVYHISDLKIDLGIAQITSYSLKERIDMFPPLAKIQHTIGYVRRPSNNYELLISPKFNSNSIV